jgi:hypothetical protein
MPGRPITPKQLTVIGGQVTEFARFRRNCRESDRTSSLLNSGKTMKQNKDENVNSIKSTRFYVNMPVALLLITRRDGLGLLFLRQRTRALWDCLGSREFSKASYCALCLKDVLTTVLSVIRSNNDRGAPD